MALTSMLAAAVMTLLKLGAGLISGSLGVLSDAAHSGLDLVCAAFTLFSVQVSDKPADEHHTYGHGKFENFSSFGEVLLMAISSAWIIWEATRRILHGSTELHHSAWPAADDDPEVARGVIPGTDIDTPGGSWLLRKLEARNYQFIKAFRCRKGT